MNNTHAAIPLQNVSTIDPDLVKAASELMELVTITFLDFIETNVEETLISKISKEIMTITTTIANQIRGHKHGSNGLLANSDELRVISERINQLRQECLEEIKQRQLKESSYH